LREMAKKCRVLANTLPLGSFLLRKPIIIARKALNMLLVAFGEFLVRSPGPLISGHLRPSSLNLLSME